MDEKDKLIQEQRREIERLKKIQRKMIALIPDDKLAKLLAEVIREEAQRP